MAILDKLKDIGKKEEVEAEEVAEAQPDNSKPAIKDTLETIPEGAGTLVGTLIDKMSSIESSMTAVRGWVEDLRIKFGSIEEQIEGVEDTKTMVEDTSEKLEKVGERVQKLMSLYEVITLKYNPFIEAEEIEKPKTVAEGISVEEGAKIDEAIRSLGLEDEEEIGIPTEIPTIREEIEETPLEYEEPARELPIYVGGEGVLLPRIKNTYKSQAMTLKWAEYLMDKIGSRNGLIDILDYYEDVRWIGEPVKHYLLTLARSFPTMAIEAPEIDEGIKRLNVDDNLRSLLFIEQIRGTPIDEAEIENIERIVQRIKSGEGFYR